MNKVSYELCLCWDLYQSAEDERLTLCEFHDAILREYNVSGMLMYSDSGISQHQSLVGIGLSLRDDGVTCRTFGKRRGSATERCGSFGGHGFE